MTAPTIRDRARMLAVGILHFGNGELASLRRLDPLAPAGAAFARAAMLWEGDDEELRGPALNKLAALAQAIAFLEPSSRRLGELLADAGFSEARLERLLRAEGDALVELAVACARFLAAKGRGVNAEDLADLLFAPEHREASVRLDIARSYFRKSQQKEVDSR